MKKILSCLFFFVTTILFGNISFVSGFLNDNYTGTVENGINGKYIGADDFLTFTLFAKVKVNNITLSGDYEIVTSRKYGYRYDILDTNISYDLNYGSFYITPSLSLLIKSDLGGEFVQNEFHKIRSLPLLIQPYSKDDVAIVLSGRFNYAFDSVFFNNDKLINIFTLSIPTDIKPIFFTLGVEYLFKSQFINFDIIGGYKHYINVVNEYSDFVRTGMIFGGQTVVKLFDKFTINIGAFFFPSQNLENDPYYSDISHEYSPQFWVTFGLNGDNFTILDIVNY